MLVAIFTCGQWVTNRARLRHELFDRRYQIYEKISGFIAGVLQEGPLATDASEEFLRQTKQAYFAFGGDLDIKKLVNRERQTPTMATARSLGEMTT